MVKKILLIICVALLAGLVYGVSRFSAEEEVPVAHAGTAQNALAEPETLRYLGTEYPIKKNIQTVLLMGTDSVDPYVQEDKLLDYYNFNQADVLMLLVLDRDTNTANIIQLNRDTMTDVPRLDVLGRDNGTEFKQLCLAYNYGDGGMKSCKNTIKTVSALLFDAPIDSYIQIPMSAISIMNDLVGGVPVTMEDDLTVLDPGFVQGTTVVLKGAQAEAYLRARMELADDSNASRMRRHRTYLDSFQKCAKEKLNSDSEFAMKMVGKLADYLQSNLTAQQLSDLVEALDKAVVAPIQAPDGKLILGAEFYEFYVDEASLWDLVQKAYCESPSA